MTQFLRRHAVRIVIGAAILAATFGVAVLCAPLLEMHVTIINNGPEPLSEVVVHVTGHHCRLGFLAVGDSRSVRVLPTSESSVEVSFVDHLRQPHRLNANAYLEQSSCGTIVLELENATIRRNEQHLGYR